MPFYPTTAKSKFEEIKSKVLNDCYQFIDYYLVDNIIGMENGVSTKINIIKYLTSDPYKYVTVEVKKDFIPTIIKVYQEWGWDVVFKKTFLEFSIKGKNTCE
jgi:hypothetical protein